MTITSQSARSVASPGPCHLGEAPRRFALVDGPQSQATLPFAIAVTRGNTLHPCQRTYFSTESLASRFGMLWRRETLVSRVGKTENPFKSLAIPASSRSKMQCDPTTFDSSTRNRGNSLILLISFRQGKKVGFAKPALTCGKGRRVPRGRRIGNAVGTKRCWRGKLATYRLAALRQPGVVLA